MLKDWPGRPFLSRESPHRCLGVGRLAYRHPKVCPRFLGSFGRLAHQSQGNTFGDSHNRKPRTKRGGGFVSRRQFRFFSLSSKNGRAQAAVKRHTPTVSKMVTLQRCNHPAKVGQKRRNVGRLLISVGSGPVGLHSIPTSFHQVDDGGPGGALVPADRRYVCLASTARNGAQEQLLTNALIG